MAAYVFIFKLAAVVIGQRRGDTGDEGEKRCA